MQKKIISSIVCILSIFLLTSGSSALAEVQNLGQIMGPHAVPAKGHFFEGWYHRVVDRDNNLSIAAIATIYKPAKLEDRKNKQMHAFVALFVSRNGEKPKLLEVKDLPGQLKAVRSGYRLDVPGVGYVSEDSLDLTVDGQRVQMQWNPEQRNPWPKSKLTGLETPEDFIARFKLFPVHWHVHDMGSFASYTYTNSETSIRSTGDFHHEKNWGKIFPSAWYWMDAMDSEQQVYISGAGGRIDLGPVPTKAFLLAIKTPEVEINFAPTKLNALYSIKTDNCQKFSITGFTDGYKFQIDTQAAKDSFVELSIPKKEGYLPGATESLQANLRVRVWKLGPKSFFGGAPLSDYTLDHVGLEFGGDKLPICK